MAVVELPEAVVELPDDAVELPLDDDVDADEDADEDDAEAVEEAADELPCVDDVLLYERKSKRIRVYKPIEYSRKYLPGRALGPAIQRVGGRSGHA